MKSDRPPSFPLFIPLPAVSFDPANYRSLTVQERKKYRGRGLRDRQRKKQRGKSLFCNNEIRQNEQQRTAKKTPKNLSLRVPKAAYPAHSMLMRI